MAKYLDHLLLARYAPPGVLINEKMDILQFRGETGDFLQPAAGEPQHNLIKMAREGLIAPLHSAIAQAKKESVPVTKKGVCVEHGGFVKRCDLVVTPLTTLLDVEERLYVVLFETAALPATKNAKSAAVKARAPETLRDGRRVLKLEHELTAVKQYLQVVIEEHGRTNDALGVVNEELVSGNEELQSMNEELETAKEELQSINEELTTVNDELHSRNQEVTRVNSDLVNVLNTVDVRIIIVDMGRRIRRFTPNVRSILSVLPSDVGRLLDDIKSNLDVPDLDHLIAEVIETVTVKEAEVQDRNGRWYRMQIRPYKTTDDKIDGALIYFIDIEALKHHTTEAQKARVEAERANLMKDQFLATLSHELRTPLTSMLMHAQMIRRVNVETQALQRASEAIERNVNMQVRLIDDLFDVSRIVTGKLNIEFQAVDLCVIVKTAFDVVGTRAHGKSIQLEVVLDEAVLMVSGDSMRLQQVVTNLLVNAVKFAPKHGRVTVTVDVHLGKARVRVSDTGSGIDPGFLPFVFNRFTQEDRSHTRTHGGLGLGFAIVYQLVGMHGGTVKAESLGAGRGATFTVTLPAAAMSHNDRLDGDVNTISRPLLSVDDRRSTVDVSHLVNLRILLVDDDPGTRDAVAEMLNEVGAEVTVADSSAAVMFAIEDFKPDVVVCDIEMPGEDGYSLIQRVRMLGSARGGNIPALALTALVGEEHRIQALAAGFQMHLAKPVDLARLTRALVELTRQRQARRIEA